MLVKALTHFCLRKTFITSSVWAVTAHHHSGSNHIRIRAKLFISKPKEKYFYLYFFLLHPSINALILCLSCYLSILLPPLFVSFTSLLNSPPPPLRRSLPPSLSSGLLACLYVSCPLWNPPLCHILFSWFYPVWIQFPPPQTAESRYWRKWVLAGCWLMGYSGLAVEVNRAR